jgi:hypothetical protein
MKRKKVKKFSLTWTKQITRSLLILGVMGGMAPYFLSVFDKQPCTEMGIAWVTEIVAVALGYFVRGFKDTKSEEDTRLKEKQIDGGLTFIDLEEEAQG